MPGDKVFKLKERPIQADFRILKASSAHQPELPVNKCVFDENVTAYVHPQLNTSENNQKEAKDEREFRQTKDAGPEVRLYLHKSLNKDKQKPGFSNKHRAFSKLDRQDAMKRDH